METGWNLSTDLPAVARWPVTPSSRQTGVTFFFASPDGWVSKFDLWNLSVVAQVRSGLHTHQLAISGDGKFLAVVNDLPNTLVLMDADLQVLKMHTVKDKNGTSRFACFSGGRRAGAREFHCHPEGRGPRSGN
jgi:hypothetical protein